MNPEQTSGIGLDIVVLGTIISCIGVIYNNVFLEHIAAMELWVASNLIFSIFFYGRYRRWWDGGLADGVMCVMYVLMLTTGLWGLWHV